MLQKCNYCVKSIVACVNCHIYLAVLLSYQAETNYPNLSEKYHPQLSLSANDNSCTSIYTCIISHVHVANDWNEQLWVYHVGNTGDLRKWKK